MKFVKDLLLFDVETMGPDPDRDPIIQLSAIVLDKDNLLEKDFFNSYVRVSLLDGTISQHAELLQIPFETLRRSPKIYDAIKKFHDKIGTHYLLCTHSTNNLLFLKQAFRKSAIEFDYNPHVLDLWTLGYVYTLNSGLKKMPTFNTLLDMFNLKRKNRHDALEKCRLAAEIFRHIIKSV